MQKDQNKSANFFIFEHLKHVCTGLIKMIIFIYSEETTSSVCSLHHCIAILCLVILQQGTYQPKSTLAKPTIWHVRQKWKCLSLWEWETDAIYSNIKSLMEWVWRGITSKVVLHALISLVCHSLSLYAIFSSKARSKAVSGQNETKTAWCFMKCCAFWR